MKKKLFPLALLTIISTLSISGCSFLSDLMNGSETNNNSSENGNKTDNDNNPDNGNQESEDTKDGLPVYTKRVKQLSLDNIIYDYSVDDRFIKPNAYLVFADDSQIDVTDSTNLSFTEADLSKPSSNQKIIAAYSCYYKNENKYYKGTYSMSFTIHIKERNDIHVDPEDDLETKTLQITDVVTAYTEGDTYIKPKIFAVKHDNSKVDVTSLSTVEGQQMDNPGVQEITITYGSHILKYDITVNPLNPDPEYPMIQNNRWMSFYRRTSVVGEVCRFYLIGINVDGQKKEYLDTTISGQEYSSSDESIAVVNDKGYITAKKAGTAYISFTFPVTYSNGTNGTTTFRSELKVEDKELITFETKDYHSSYYSGSSINFYGNFVATYQNGFEENVTPDIDLSDVNLSVPGEYVVHVSYTVNGKTIKEDLNITILDSALYTVEKTSLSYDIDDYLINSPVAVTGLPHSGTIKSIVVPVKFTDTDNYISNYANVKSDINDVFFGTNETVGWRSVKTYYESESLNKITFTGTTTDWYDTGHPSSYYYDVNKAFELKEEVVEWFFENHPEEDRKSYDSNHDGLIDGLNIVYGSLDRTTGELGPGAEQMWAMVKKYRNQTPNVEKPVSDCFLWMSYDMIYPTQAIALARTEKSNYAYDDKWGTGAKSLKLDPLTAIHETGHMFGISDYYSYSEDDVYYAGHTNMQTLNILGHDPYSVILYDWADPFIPENSVTINIGDFQNTHDVILLTPNWNEDNSPFDEYFLIELYAPTGNNEYEAFTKMTNYGHGTSPLDYQTVGVRIWHVDARIKTASSNYEDFTTNPNIGGRVCYIANNSKGDSNIADLSEYSDYVELQLVRNNTDYDLMTSSYFYYIEFFQAGDSFDMNTYASQFMNGNKMNDGRTLPWTVNIKGIYHEGEGYSADVELIKQ